ncbi:hypothetical protein F5X96DRAFT_670283 [Biscogniauxia mediterranea]|nr:hypothetical protein F5X96DRAFT_670283 [Biscogniauxia mediterranea]
MSSIVNNISQRVVHRVDGCYLYFKDESGDEYEAIDACAGAATVSHNCGVTYKALELAEKLRQRTKGHMTRITTATSGSQAVETSLKYAMNYFALRAKTERSGAARVQLISRDESYLPREHPRGALSASGFQSRRAPYEGVSLRQLPQTAELEAKSEELKHGG